MKRISDFIAEELAAAFEAAGYDRNYAKVTLSNRPDLCEYQCNGAMAGAKAYHKAPIMIAQDVVAKLEGSGCFCDVQAVNPGFINLKLDERFVADYLDEMETDEDLGLNKTDNPKMIVIDYGGPNVAKPLHVGHLRSAIIGESVNRILKENIRQRLHLPYLSWRRSIRQQVEKQKRMRSTESVRCMPHIYSKTDIKVIQQSGTTLCMYL